MGKDLALGLWDSLSLFLSLALVLFCPWVMVIVKVPSLKVFGFDLVCVSYVGNLISFQTFFVQAFKIVVDTWIFSMLLLFILWYDWPIFMISGSKEQLRQELEYTLLKPDWHRWWISKMQSGREDTLEERYVINFCFKFGKIPQKRMECFRLLLEHLSGIAHQFLSGIR